MDRLFKLAKHKDKLKKKLNKINHKIELINQEALSYKSKGTDGQDVFIRCLVENLHFETIPPTDSEILENFDGYECKECEIKYRLVHE